MCLPQLWQRLQMRVLWCYSHTMLLAMYYCRSTLSSIYSWFYYYYYRLLPMFYLQHYWLICTYCIILWTRQSLVTPVLVAYAYHMHDAWCMMHASRTPYLAGGATVGEVHTATELTDTIPEQHTGYISTLQKSEQKPETDGYMEYRCCSWGEPYISCRLVI